MCSLDSFPAGDVPVEAKSSRSDTAASPGVESLQDGGVSDVTNTDLPAKIQAALLHVFITDV